MRRRKKRRNREPHLFDIIEEAYRLLRRLPAGDWLYFYLGSCPFIVALIHFWTDFAHYKGDIAFLDIASRALILVFLYLLMKGSQGLFCQRLIRFHSGSEHAKMTIREASRLFLQQGAVQSTSWIVTMLSLIFLLPFAWVVAFYQNFSFAADGRKPLGMAFKEAYDQAMLWPRMNHLAIWVASPVLLIITLVSIQLSIALMKYLNPEFAMMEAGMLLVLALGISAMGIVLSPLPFVVALNVGIGIMAGPELLRIFLGVETTFSMSAAYAMGATFQLVICSVTYLIMEPFLKAVYAVRCFRGFSRRNGKDLSIALRQFGKAGMVALLLLASVGAVPSTLQAQSTETGAGIEYTADDLDNHLDRVLSKKDYHWRQNTGDGSDRGEMPGWWAWWEERIEAFWNGVEDVWDWIKEQFKKLIPDMPETGVNMDGMEGAFKAVRTISLILIALAIVYLLVVIYKRIRAAPQVEMSQVGKLDLMQSVADESVLADEVPADEWWNLGLELLGYQNYRLALRAFYLSSLSRLASAGLILITRSKTNNQYLGELRKTCRHRQQVLEIFQLNTHQFEDVWYGDYLIGEEGVNEFRKRVIELGGCLEH